MRTLLVALLLTTCHCVQTEMTTATSVDMAVQLDANYSEEPASGRSQVGVSDPTERICRWDACGGPLPDKQQQLSNPVR